MDLTEPLEDVKKFQAEQQFPFQLALADAKTLQSWGFVGRDTKFVVGTDGVIAYRGDYGSGSDEGWRTIFQDLTRK